VDTPLSGGGFEPFDGVEAEGGQVRTSGGRSGRHGATARKAARNRRQGPGARGLGPHGGANGQVRMAPLL
jgi:hypothetical protein